ncbi:serine hydrolase domain-containing protein, partial [Bacteroidota bacterium]
MKKYILIILLAIHINSNSQSLYFPPNSGNTWDTISISSMGWCQDRIDSLYNYLDQKNTKAFIFLQDGKIVLEKYFGTFTQDSLWYWASAGKTLIAFTVGVAQQENLLYLSDTTSKFLGQGWTSCPPNKEALIKIRHQLTMTSGLDDGVSDPYCTLDTCLQYLTDAGTRWAYHNAPYTLLDEVLAATSGQTLNQYIASKIQSTTGMDGAFFKVDYINLYLSNARSMARFGLLMLGKGKWNNTPVLTDSVYFNEMVNTSQSLNLSYGYLTWLNGKSSFMIPGLQYVFSGPICPDAPADMHAALGKNAQIINVVPSKNMVWIRMGNAPGTGSDITPTFNNDIWKFINQLPCPSGINESIDKKARITVYPNPVND